MGEEGSRHVRSTFTWDEAARIVEQAMRNNA